MTSKEALETLVYGLTNNQYAKEDLGITMSKCREIIKNDLEVLEILKKYLTIKDYEPMSFPPFIILSGNHIENLNDAKKIKEWLENEQIL